LRLVIVSILDKFRGIARPRGGVLLSLIIAASTGGVVLGIAQSLISNKKVNIEVIRLASDGKTYRVMSDRGENREKIAEFVQSQLKEYVVEREAYNYFTLSTDYTHARELSHPEVAAAMDAQINTIFKAKAEKNFINFDEFVDIEDFRIPAKNTAEITFKKTRIENATGDKEDLGRFVAFIQYDFANLAKSNDSVSNPTHLRITKYTVRKL